MKDSILLKLEYFNDPKFVFDDTYHKYTYDGERFESVTKFIQKFHKPFDEDYWSKKKAKELNKDQSEVLIDWKKINERATSIGTSTHNWIENYFNGIHQCLPNDIELIDRINKFNISWSKWLHRLTPLKFEQRVFSKKWKIAGTLDALFLYKDQILIIDYKTNKKFTHDEDGSQKFEKLLYPFDNYNKNNLNEYSIQVSMYKLILREVGIDIKNCYLLYIGPDEDPKFFKAHDFCNVLEDYLNH